MNVETETDADGARRYRFDDGAEYPSVTTIIDATLDKPGLEAWKARTPDAAAIAARARKVGSVAHYRCLDPLAIRATAPPNVDVAAFDEDMIADVEVCCALFDDACAELGLSDAPRIEVPVRHDDHEYAGRADVVDGDTVLDLKTSKAIYDSHRLQSAAYAKAVGAERARVVQLNYRAPAYRIEEIDIAQWWPQFVELREAYDA